MHQDIHARFYALVVSVIFTWNCVSVYTLYNTLIQVGIHRKDHKSAELTLFRACKVLDAGSKDPGSTSAALPFTYFNLQTTWPDH